MGAEDLDQVKTWAHEVIGSTRRFKPDARIDGVLLQEMARGLEMIVGSVNDPVFGPYVMVGAGGVFSEIIRDTTLRFAPFGVREALDMLDELKIARVLRGYRGARPYDIDAIADALVRVSELVADHAATIAELDINPLFVRHAGEAVIAADGLAGLKPVAQR